MSESSDPPYQVISAHLPQVRDALRAIGVPEHLLTVRAVETAQDLVTGEEGEPVGDSEQMAGLVAMLHRVVVSMRANIAVELLDTPQEDRLLAVDRLCAQATDWQILEPEAGPIEVPASRRVVVSTLGRATEESRWLQETLTTIMRMLHADDDCAAPDKCQGVPAPLVAARTLIRATAALLMLTQLDLNRPASTWDGDDAQMLAQLVAGLRTVTGTLLDYGTAQGLLERTGTGHYRVLGDEAGETVES